MTKLKIKLAEGAVLPSKANPSDSGYDITATSVRYDEEYGFLEYGTGVFLHIPEGYEVNLLPRSSISKYDLIMCNSPGKVDELYRKELFFRFKPTKRYDVMQLLAAHGTMKCGNRGSAFVEYINVYKVGDKIGQLEMRKKHEYELLQVDDVDANERGGFGSTDRQKMKQAWDSNPAGWAN